MFRTRVNKLLLSTVAVIGLAGMFPSAADAGSYTVYIYNTRRNEGWIRTGFTHDLYTTYSACRNSITSRVNENKRYRTDFEAFAIIEHKSRPPAGRLGNFVRGWIIYQPGRGYASSGEAQAPETGLCRQDFHVAPSVIEQGRHRILSPYIDCPSIARSDAQMAQRCM